MSEEDIKDKVFCANCALYEEEGTEKCDCVAMRMERKRPQNNK